MSKRVLEKYEKYFCNSCEQKFSIYKLVFINKYSFCEKCYENEKDVKKLFSYFRKLRNN